MKNNFRKYYLIAIIILFVGLAFSKILISISQFLLLGLWLVEGNFKQKFTQLKQDKPALIFLSMYIIYIIGLLWTKNIPDGINDLKIKLPLLIIPLIFCSIPPLTKKEINIILISFISVIFIKTLTSAYTVILNELSSSSNDIMHNISHIRYSLLIDVAIFALINFILFTKKTKYKILSAFAIIWFLLLLVIILSITGIVIFIIGLILLFTFFILKSNKTIIKYLSFSVILIVIIGSFFYLKVQYNNFFTFKDVTFEQLPVYTENGNKYQHDSSNFYIENGYHTGYYLCENELKNNWNKISNIKYESVDNQGYKIKYTLVRYLTSKGLTKDSVGISKLSENDIKNIQNGIANYRYDKILSISNRIYKIIWQFYVYNHTHNANNQSITQRYEYLVTSFHIINKNLLFGVGTGDTKIAFEQQYIIDDSKLTPQNRRRSHNQLVTFILTFGVIIGSWCIIALFIPFFMNKKSKDFLPSAFFIIIVISMLTDNSLETSISTSFFAIFYTLLILQKTKPDKTNTNDFKSTN